jgi:hypothetical protein
LAVSILSKPGRIVKQKAQTVHPRNIYSRFGWNNL